MGAMTADTLADRLAAGEAAPVVAEPTTLVIFGGAGDLAHRKLLPALYNLYLDGFLPPRFAVVGVGRREINDEAYREFAKDGIRQFSRRPIDELRWPAFAEALFFVNRRLEDPTRLSTLGARLDTVEPEPGLPGNRVYYLAVPPSLFVQTVEELSRARFIAPPDSKTFSRLIVEKPIGRELASARQIDDAIARVFDERQIFRIDHYLGKETVQNILVLRFANSFFEPLFNQKHIDHVQITVAEAEGVGTRAGYYEQAGALRDMVQNHLLQLLTLVAMEPPYSLDADVVRDEKLEVLQSLRPLTGEAVDQHTVRAQYTAGFDMGNPVPGYLEEPRVDPQSRTETFVALQVLIDNWRWAGVPFFLRTGKRLPKRASEISIHLKEVPPILFNKNPERRLDPNVLAIRIQPDEGFALRISSKSPGPRVQIHPVNMDFRYGNTFGTSTPEAYERLLLDVLAGDATLFMRRDSVEASWKWVTPILERWAERRTEPLPAYPAGTWGPPEADSLIEAAGRLWLAL
jgi:glucose-6-phosphate 1-dehydrogenase